MTNKIELENTIESLTRSAMYQMSLGSKELFHSNFLAWLFKTYPSSIRAIGLKSEGKNKVVCEKQHVDIVITNNLGTTIIENKGAVLDT